MCETNQPPTKIVAHIPICYRKMCQEMGIHPLCTCDGCEGKRAHNIDLTRENFSLPTKKEAERIPSPPVSIETNEEGEDRPSPNVLVGKECVLCGTTKSKGTLKHPTIFIGQNRSLLICKKSHVTNEGDAKR